MMRQISDNGLLFTSLWEKFSPLAYKATPAEKYFTIGFGHYGPDVKQGQQITKQAAIELLKIDMSKAVKKADELASKLFTQSQFDAICDLCFNVGTGIIENDETLNDFDDAVRNGDIINTRRIMAQFINQSGKPLLGLRRRTAGRLALFDGKSAYEAESIGRAVR